jgi:sn-glycerol 3-phosphate transport system substrate-binding protein
MKRRTLLAGTAALAGTGSSFRPATAQATRTKVVFWHAMSGPLGEEVNRIAAAFNASQQAVELQPFYKGAYPETLTAAIAAWRAGQAPHLVQMFEVGTGSMLAAGPAVKQVWQLIADTGAAIDPTAYVAAVRGYYSLPDGRLASMPFNSSTPLMWYNKDAFEKAGLDPDAPPATWQALEQATRALKALAEKDKTVPPIPMTTSWPTWIQMECYGAIHDLPFATKENGFAGLDTELLINAPGFVRQVQRLLDWSKDGLFKYTGRDNTPDPVFTSGQAAIGFNSSGSRSTIGRDAKFRWAPALLPYDPEVKAEPINSIIGGASLWTMTAPGRTVDEYKGVAAFLQFIASPENAAAWHQHTGYVPVTYAGYELSRSQGYYEKNPGADLPIKQLTRGQVTPNSKGFRLGRMPEIRVIIQEEIEKGLQGQQDAQTAMNNAVMRGNKVLREFEKSVRA